MKVIGLTGGIGSGKSTVAGFLGKLGAVVMDTDRLWHEALRRDAEVRRMVVETFGQGVLEPGGDVDRKRLARVVFSDPEALDRLNRIVHPWMYEKVKILLEECRGRGVEVVVLEIPLLVEASLYMRAGQLSLSDELDKVWVTVAREDTVLRRLEKKGLRREETLKRIRSQISSEERTRRADVVIDTDRRLEEVEAEVGRLWENLSKE